MLITSTHSACVILLSVANIYRALNDQAVASWVVLAIKTCLAFKTK